MSKKTGKTSTANIKLCHDCGAKPGTLHLDGCDVERCPACGGQMLSCGCPNEESSKYPRQPWTGEWPGKFECREFGWYAKFVEGQGWVSCGKNEDGASEDLNRLYCDAVWVAKLGRFVIKLADAGKLDETANKMKMAIYCRTSEETDNDM